MPTVATFNILHGLDPASGQLDLAAVARAITAFGAEVVALQEVDRGQSRSCGVDQVAWLAEELGWHGVFAPTLLGDPNRQWVEATGDDPGGPAYGVGLISRGRVFDVRRRRLPGSGDGYRSSGKAQRSRPGWDREPRVALSCTAETSDGVLGLTVTHLSYLPWRGMAQLRVASREGAGPPWVLLGDLNLPPWAVRLATRGWDHHPTAPTHPSREPRLRIDQVLTRGLEVTDVRVGEAEVSDHLPVVAEVRPR